MRTAEPAKPVIEYISLTFWLIFKALILQGRHETIFLLALMKNYHRAILFLNIDFEKGMHEFLDKQTRTSIMQFTLTLSEIQWERECLKVVTC